VWSAFCRVGGGGEVSVAIRFLAHTSFSCCTCISSSSIKKKNCMLCYMDFILRVIVPWVFVLILSGHSINSPGRNTTPVFHSSGSPARALYNKHLKNVYWIELHHGGSRIWWTKSWTLRNKPPGFSFLNSYQLAVWLWISYLFTLCASFSSL